MASLEDESLPISGAPIKSTNNNFQNMFAYEDI